VALQLQPKGVNWNAWFSDDKLLPGWRVSWRLGVLKNGAFAVKDLHIDRYDAALNREWRTESDFQAWLAALTIPGQGITTRLLRKLRLREPTARTKRILKQQLPRRVKSPKENRGRPLAHSLPWYRELERRYNAAPSKKALAHEYGMTQGAMRTAVHRYRRDYRFMAR
jgi:hypothetical protein